MTIPNKLTISRVILTLVIVVLLFWKSFPYNYLLSTIIFIVAMFTDVLDGYIARKYHLISDFGSFLDPIADKLLILLVSLFLYSQQIFPLWLILILFSRELIVDAFRSFAVSQNIYLGAIKLGKIKAFGQTLANILGLFYLTISNHQLVFNFLDSNLFKDLAYYFMLVAVLISLVGMFIHFKRHSYALFKNIKY